jgi:C_GCAxxG_C_C family probable redox protein
MDKNASGSLFSKGFNCAQSVLAAKSNITGLSVADSLKIATGFGAGMAMMQKTCGAVTGAYLVIGALNGRVKPEDTDARDRTYALIEKFNNEFIRLHGGLSCRELLGVDLRTPEGRQEAESNGYFGKKCAKYVEDAERILDKILDVH